MVERILITSALPYANGPLHFGHIAGAYLPGDCYARYQRLKKNDVLYICGSDEYGIAITLSAELAHRTPQEHVDIFHKKNYELFQKLEFSFDNYSRTTWKGHKQTVQQFFLDLCDNGYIEEKIEQHLFSEAENKFLADRYVIGTCPKCGYPEARGDECSKCGASYEALDLKNPKSKLTKSALILKPSKHWYLRFDKFKDKLLDWIEKKDWKKNVLNMAKEYIKDLKPRSITRDSTWGIPIPLEGTEGKVFYVWFDAPIGYISATKEWAEKIKKPDEWQKYWFDQSTKLVHFIGKDNIPFHTVFFPAMIMGQNQPYILPFEVPANEFFLLEGRQFSKSDGWYIDLDDFFEKYTPDQIRYYLAANAPETSDSEFTWKDFQARCNSELLGKFGNFINRTLVFLKNNFHSKIPQNALLEDKDQQFLKEIKEYVKSADGAYSSFQLRKASQIIMELAHSGNVYFDNKKPWLLIKDEKAKGSLEAAMLCSLECIKCLALISSPIIPYTAQEIWHLLGYKTVLSSLSWDEVLKNPIPLKQILPEPKILFRKIEDDEIELEINKLKKPKKDEPSFVKVKNEVSYSEFEKLDLRVAEIISAEKIEKSQKLLKLLVDVGFEKRQIVAGIAKDYEPKELIGKKVVIIANLKPTRILGIESQGMVLVGGSNELELPIFKELKSGEVVS